MHALILATGRSRHADPAPSCFVRVGGRLLLHHQLDAALVAGAERITVVTGHEHELVGAAVGERATVVRNARYAETNSLYSFWLARRRARGEVLVMNCDVLFPPSVLRALVRSGNALAFDSRFGDGEDPGLLHLNDDVAQATFEAADMLLRSGCERDSLGSAVNVVARRHPIARIDTHIAHRDGFPKIDRLPDGTLDREGIVRDHRQSGGQPVVSYAPTGARGN